MGAQLTPEQLANWRKVLISIVGPYAVLLSEAQIQVLRDSFQVRADTQEFIQGMIKQIEDPPCES